MDTIGILFFGSTSDSVIVLEKLSTLPAFAIKAVVTQPARPVGRDQTITPTPVETWATEKRIPVLTFASDKAKPWLYQNPQQVIDTLQPVAPDLIISASYGQMIPADTIRGARFGGLNVHPSILPRWRGGDPVPWAILSGDHQIGVTVVTLSPLFDAGEIYAQEKIPLLPTDTSDALRTRLFGIGADLLGALLPDYIRGKAKPLPVRKETEKPPYAKRFTRDDGYEPWENILSAIETGADAERIERKYRALHPWPGVWTKITSQQSRKMTHETRLKIVTLHLDRDRLIIDQVQLEGKNPVSWEQFKTAYLLNLP
jgi:methionyl-tRNA formyltransferase